MSEIPVGWTELTLGDVVTPRGEKVDPQELGDAPFIGMDHVEAYSSKLLGTRPVSELKSAVAVFKEGDVLYGRLRPYLNKVFRATFDGAASAEFMVFPPSPEVDQEYLITILRQPRFVEFAMLRSTGDRPRVKFDTIADYSFPLPPLVEQREIVARLRSLTSRTYRARDELSHVPRLFKRYRQALLHSAFAGELTRNWRAQHTTLVNPADIVREAAENCIRVRRSKLPNRSLVPDDVSSLGWVTARMEDICTQIVDGTHHTPDYKPSGVPFISVKDIYDHGIYFDDCKYISEEQHAELAKRCNPQPSDILITKSGTIGRTAVVNDDCPEFSLFVSVALIRLATDKILPEFVQMALEYWIGQIDIANEITGSTIKNLHLQDIKALEAPIPSLEEQAEIISCVEAAVSRTSRFATEAERSVDLLEKLDSQLSLKATSGGLVSQSGLMIEAQA